MITISRICLALTLSLEFASTSMAEVQTRKIPVLSQILDDDGNPAEDISGIACLNGLGPSPICLLINDEDREGQLARFGSDGISPTARFKLLTKSTQASALGSPPGENKCPAGGDSFDDLDGEAVAADSAKKVFYVAASHGCSRKKGKFRISSFLLARVAMTNSGDVGTVDTIYRRYLNWRFSGSSAMRSFSMASVIGPLPSWRLVLGAAGSWRSGFSGWRPGMDW
jgi:hypothetical protein